MGSGVSRSSNLRGFLGRPDASDRMDVVTVLSRIEVRRHGERPRCTRTLTSDARGLSVCSVDWRLHRDRRLAVTVEKLRRWVESVRPDDRACLLIDTRLAEVLGIAQW